MSYSKLLLLVVANMFWAANPTAAKILIGEVGHVTTAWLKYSTALLAFMLFFPAIRSLFPAEEKGRHWLAELSLHDLIVLLCIGLTTCFLSPLCQMQGLTTSSAISNSLLVAMEPLFTLALAYFLLNDPFTRRDALALATGVVGFLILSGFFSNLKTGELSGFLQFASKGDLFLIFAILCEACYSVLPKKLVGRHPGFQIYGTALAIGFIFQTIYLLIVHGMPRLELLSVSGWGALVWLGPIGTTVTYLIWIRVIQHGVPISSMILTLFLQPLFGTLAGYLMLHEPLHLYQAVGAAFILAAVTWQSLQAEMRHGQSEGIQSAAEPVGLTS